MSSGGIYNIFNKGSYRTPIIGVEAPRHQSMPFIAIHWDHTKSQPGPWPYSTWDQQTSNLLKLGWEDRQGRGGDWELRWGLAGKEWLVSGVGHWRGSNLCRRSVPEEVGPRRTITTESLAVDTILKMAFMSALAIILTNCTHRNSRNSVPWNPEREVDGLKAGLIWMSSSDKMISICRHGGSN